MALPIQAALLALVLTAGAFDVHSRRIPNWISLAAAALGLGLHGVVPGGSGWAFSFAGLLLGFGVYLVFYALHAMGAGDVKLMAAVGSLAGCRAWVGIFLMSAIFGGILALLIVLLRRRARRTFWNIGYILGEMRHGRAAYLTRRELDVDSPDSVGLPHAAVVAIGTVFFLAGSAWLAG